MHAFWAGKWNRKEAANPLDSKKPLERKVRYFEKKNRVGLQTLFFALKTNVILSHKRAKCQMEINVTTILQNTFLTYKKKSLKA